MAEEEKRKEWWQLKRIWFAFGVIVLVIAFGIAQPILWRWQFGEPPPAGVMSLSAILTIIIALLALGMTGFSALIYGFLRDQLRVRIEKDIKAAEEEAHAHIERHLKQLEEDSRITIIRMNLINSNFHWIQYRELWERGEETKPSFAFHLNQALFYARETFRLSEKLEKTPRNEWFMYESKNILAFHLATRKYESDKDEAFKLAKYVKEKAEKENNYHWLETYYWVVMRFTEEGRKEFEKARQGIEKLLKRQDIDKSWRDRTKIRYRKAFPHLFSQLDQ